jgi:ubiquinone/menaquinone biosynthesis C-methylase UbiE
MALHEARRILKPKGVLIAAAISRFASLIDGLSLITGIGLYRKHLWNGLLCSEL